jgi:hypothetical protein
MALISLDTNGILPIDESQTTNSSSSSVNNHKRALESSSSEQVLIKRRHHQSVPSKFIDSFFLQRKFFVDSYSDSTELLYIISK